MNPNEIILSEEQQEFIDQALNGENILVDACIGSGKTTAIQYLCNYIKDKQILYLTYMRIPRLYQKVRSFFMFSNKGECIKIQPLEKISSSNFVEKQKRATCKTSGSSV